MNPNLSKAHGNALLLAAFLCLATGAHAQSAPGAEATDSGARAGTAKVVKGQVDVSGRGAERALVAGGALSATDRVTTGPDSSASLVLRDGTLLVVGPNSRMELQEFAFNPTTHDGNMVVGVLRGTVRMVSGLIRKTREDAVRVVTPTALVGIRGTDFIVDVEPSEDGS